mmetsp:Transcript_18546/g.39812  ORF Transcript_18546/g.39812 Transcript_18546/m.39812 type:complete len:97 (+) Transcript_18546:595-885(+)
MSHVRQYSRSTGPSSCTTVKYRRKLLQLRKTGQGVAGASCETELQPLDQFYIAESEHQGFYERNMSTNAYCSRIITPKIDNMEVNPSTVAWLKQTS